MAIKLKFRGTQGPAGPAGAPGGSQPLGPKTVQASMLADGVVPATTDSLTEGTVNRYATADTLDDLIEVEGGLTKNVAGGKLYIDASGVAGGGGGGGPVDTDALTEGDTNLYFTLTRLNERLAVQGGLTKNIVGDQLVLTGGGTGGSGLVNTDGLPQGTTNRYFLEELVNAMIVNTTSVTKSYNATTKKLSFTASGGGSGSLSAADAAKLASFRVWIPSDTSGNTDMTNELEAFVAANQGYTVKVPDFAKIRLADAGLGDTTNHWQIDFGNATILFPSSCTFAVNLDNTMNASAEVSVTSIAEVVVNTDARVSQATLSGGTLSAKEFDWVALYSNNANPAKAGGCLGEIAQLITDEASGKITFCRKLNHHGRYSSAVKVRKLNATRKVDIRGGVWRAAGDPLNHAITTRAGAMRIMGFVDPIVRDLIIERVWSEGVRFQACAQPILWNYRYRDNGNLAQYKGYTYGCRLYGMNDGADLARFNVRNGRHSGLTTDGNGDGTTAAWYNKGIPTNGRLFDVIAMHCHASPVDFHEEGDGFIVDGVQVFYPYQDEHIAAGSGFTGLGVQVRSSNVIIRNYTQIGGTRGFKINALDFGFQDTVTLENISLKDFTAGASADSDVGIEINDMGSLANKRHIRINGLYTNNVGIACKVGTGAKVTLTNYHPSRMKTAMTIADGAQVTFKGPSSFDYRENPRAASYNGITMAGTSRCVFDVEPVVLRDTNSPTALIVSSGSGTKTIYAPGLMDDRTGTASAMSIYSGSGFAAATVARVAWANP